jgi:hypothetical protein
VFDCSRALRAQIRPLLRRLPELEGRPVRIEFRNGLEDRYGVVHGGAFLRERRITLDAGLRGDRRELARILSHELAHFTWIRLGNRRRREYETLIFAELARGARGELGWSAEWRKSALAPGDWVGRSRRWREYLAESFCDTTAWRYSGLRNHLEFTLAERFCRERRLWLESVVTKRMPI